jgi:mannose-6-phosphate isomerase-like protein (cupin superfamily)
VVKQGEAYANPRTGTRIEIQELGPERLVFVRRYPPATGKADPHVHLDFSQTWEVLSGTATLAIDGKIRRLTAGESVEAGTGEKHQDPYNETDGELSVRWRVEPVTDFVEGYLNAFAHGLARDELNDQDEFPMLQLFVILNATRARSYTTAVPIGVQKATLPLLAAVGRLRGYRPSYLD